MRNTKLFLAFTFILAFAALGFSQSTLAGRVVQVLDGRTVVIEISSGKLTAEIQYIEVPEPEQPLHGTVREHLEKLVLNKDVIFRSAGFAPGKTFGQLFVNSADIAIQMLRDGAAWHVSPEKSGQKPSDSDAYAYHQTQAKLENRGVWGVKDLKPAWQFRADLKAKQASEKSPSDHQSGENIKHGEKTSPAVRMASPNARKSPLDPDGQMSRDVWVEVTANPYKHDYGIHKMSTELDGIVGLLATSPEFIYVHSGNSRQKIVCRAVYATREKPDGNPEAIVILGVQAISETVNLAKIKNSLSIVADGKRIPVFGLLGLSKQEYYGVDERLAYGISPGNFRKIASAKNVEITIDKHKGKLSPSTLTLFRQLSDAM